MDNQNNEHSQGAEEALNGLPDKEREETQNILDEIAAEAPKDGKPEEKPKEEAKPKEGEEAKPKENDGKPDENNQNNKPEARREVKLMPSWLHERAKADWEKREKDLTGKIEELSKGATKTEDGAVVPSEDLDKEVDALAEELNLDSKVVKRIVDLASKRGGVPPELLQKLDEVERFRQAEAIKTEAIQFNQDFDKIVLPLIKAEYGDDVSADIIEGIRDKTREIAYTPEYSKVPYSTIYKGDDQFREVISEKKKGAEGSRGGHTQEASAVDGEQIDLASPQADDVIKKMSDAQFDQYEKNMEKFEKSKK